MKKVLILTFAIVCVLCLVACQSPQEEVGEMTMVPGDSPSSEEPSVTDDRENGEDSLASNSTSDETVPLGNGEPEAITPEPVDECVNCHTDQQMLIDTAKPLEVVESENEGEG